ncbi:hypothetical protein AB0M20_22845 [Actinoplanes sp. NPDC051633]|uniref:hypothetical protein n=1 Tax=Actinoplanes sp. NPDC051633 TaxID=3155670 RepID=UPI003417D587
MSATTEPSDGTPGSPHRPTHRRLLHSRPHAPAGDADVDATIVPAGRHASQLEQAVELAAKLDTPLVALCSREAAAHDVGRRWANDAAVVAVDLRGRIRLPKLSTSAIINRTPFARDSDTAVKRNVGLALTRMLQWDRVLFLDDDIEGVQPDQTRRAAGLLDDFEIVGLMNNGFPDNSVVCHANRDTGAYQSTFIGAGAMLFRGSRSQSLFPDIYNEDWFFVLDDDTISPCAVDGQFAQRPFDPYKNPGRAGSEEFGDCLAEGIYALLDSGRSIHEADRHFWEEFLTARRDLIGAILRRLPATEISYFRRQQIKECLLAALANLELITAELCTIYLKAWRDDCERWRAWVTDLPRYDDIDDALAHLGLYR